MNLELSKDAEKKLIASIRRYAAENLESDIGDLQASLFLRYCLEEIGPVVYNAAVTDARKFLQERLEDLETSLYAPELGYWPAQDKKGQRIEVRRGRG